MMEQRSGTTSQVTLADILDKVLDKGLVVVGDVRIYLANVELLTIRVRLLLCSLDKATEIGIDWWKSDRFLNSGGEQDVKALEARIDRLEERLLAALQPAAPDGRKEGAGRPRPRSARRRQTGGHS